VQVAAELRARVVEATRGLTCSVGVAPNMMLAKIASDRNKPDGQCVVGATREEVLQFIADLPIRKVRLLCHPVGRHHVLCACSGACGGGGLVCVACAVPVQTLGLWSATAVCRRKVSSVRVVRCLNNQHDCVAHCTPCLLQIPGIGKVTEQTLQALGVSSCSDLIRQATLLTALLSDISSSSLIEAGLGLGATEHHARGGGEGSSEPGRKGISCERTFGAMSTAAEMEAMVSHCCCC
jgi:nucleotidyltransferase/DNA polymerase involved in DNA repair